MQDLSFRAARFPAPGETRVGTFATGPGGKGFNQAVACHRQGVGTQYVGAVGQDPFADGLRRFIDAEGLAADLQVSPDRPTGAASIVVNDEGENLIVVGMGANLDLSESHIDSLASVITRADVLVVQLECNLDAVRRALELARGASVTTVLNPAPINDALDQTLLELVDIIVPNESEYVFLLDHLFDLEVDDPATAESSELVDSARQLGVPTVIITLGEKGAVILDADGRCEDVDSIDVVARDTTGAGDGFTGGLAAGLALFGGDVKAAVEYATIVAGLSTEVSGTAPSMPTAERVNERMDEGRRS